MICVYPADCTDFSNNGLGAVTPMSCTVTETLNGEWELTLVHDIDERGKWTRLSEGCILRAPVPAAMTPRVDLVTQQYQTSTYDVQIYKITTKSGPLHLRSGTGTNYRILGKYKKGREVIVLNKTTSSWYEVTAPDGKHGYMASQYLTFQRTETQTVQTNVGFRNQVIEARQLRDQPFRIYRVVPELDKVTVYARHIFYDLLDNMVKSLKPSPSAVGASVVQSLSGACLSSHDFSFYSDLTSTAEDVEWENINPVEAMLGENGLVSKYGAELARDWYDVFLVRRVGNNTDVSIREKKNLTGISYDVDETDVVTRIMPTGEDADGNILYLPELYIDSPNLNAYTHPKWIHLPVSEAKEVTDGDEPKIKAQCYAEMRKAAQAEFDAGCDLPTVTLKVDFINCSDAEEYKQYAALTDIFLGDSVRVVARRIGVEVSMRMTQYTYDCLTRKYTSVTLGTAADTLEGSMISSRQLPSGVISGSKLAINSVGAGQLQSGSVGSLQVKMAAIQTAHIQDAAITKAKIAEATIGELNATAITAISAKIQELAAKNITTDELYAALATIAVAQITAANIEKANINWADIGELAAQIATIAQAQITTANINSANIDWASIANLNAEIAKIAKAQITAANIESAAIDWAAIKDLNAAVAKIALAQLTTANINNAEIDWASIGQLQADIAKLVNANIQTADIDWAQIKDLTAGTAIIEKGVNGKLYVADLAVTEANMASLTVGELIVKGADGCFYALSIAENGTVTTEKKSVGDADIGDNSVSGGKLIEKTITARELNVASIFADEALVGAITAANIDVSSLFAAEAFIAQLNAVDISGNESLRLVVDAAKDEALDATGEAVAQIALTAEQIRSEVRRDYATADQISQMNETLSTLAEQSENNFTWTVTKVNEIIEDAAANDSLTREQLNLIHTYMRFGEDGLTIGKAGNPLTFRVVNDRLAFYMNDTEVAYLSDNKLYVTQAEILARLQIGKFAYEPQSNGNLSVIYTG
ncbi:MAG: phage tail spike protein [Candidatus Limiplasma sp.]|nr:phage tail spike protein [Candidatus Limiplasma sp.]